jgi:hypothetical protein
VPKRPMGATAVVHHHAGLGRLRGLPDVLVVGFVTVDLGGNDLD